MSGEVAFWLFLSGAASVASFFAGSWTSDAAWAHRTRVREMLHAEKMALIEERQKMLEVKP